MLRLQIIVSIILTFTVQCVLGNISPGKYANNNDTCWVETSFEEDSSIPKILGEVPAGQLLCHVSVNFVMNNSGFDKRRGQLPEFSALLKSQLSVKKVNFDSNTYQKSSAVYIPIYVRTARFLL